MSKDNQTDKHIKELEGHYRPCACRSSTPFFSERERVSDVLTHTTTSGSQELYRTKFQHDRDKILYSKYFRRLRLKTQIFPEHIDDHLRTRLDHTLEVSQIGRHFARQLQLNEDLVDAIALAHDIGHTPFGHSGERALHRFLIEQKLDGFKHNWHGLRVVDLLDKSYPDHWGLNLTRAVRLGIFKHTKPRYSKTPEVSCSCDMEKSYIHDFGPLENNKWTNLFEIQVSTLSDDIAQLIHDLEDAILSRAINFQLLVVNREEHPLLNGCIENIRRKTKKIWRDIEKDPFRDRDQESFLLARIRSELIYQLTLDVVVSAREKLRKWEETTFPRTNAKKKITAFNQFVTKRKDFPEIIGINKLKDKYDLLKNYINDEIVRSERVSRMDAKADYVLRKILETYLNHPKQISQSVFDSYKHLKKIKADIRNWNDEQLSELKNDKIFIRSVVDHVAGMTDRFALKEYDQLYSPYPRREL